MPVRAPEDMESEARSTMTVQNCKPATTITTRYSRAIPDHAMKEDSMETFPKSDGARARWPELKAVLLVIFRILCVSLHFAAMWLAIAYLKGEKVQYLRVQMLVSNICLLSSIRILTLSRSHIPSPSASPTFSASPTHPFPTATVAKAEKACFHECLQHGLRSQNSSP